MFHIEIRVLLYLPERVYVTFGYKQSQNRLSVVCHL